MDCRVLKTGKCIITQYYNQSHPATDLVGDNYTLDYIVAHSDGKIIAIQDGLSNLKGSTGMLAYGNYIKIDHGNGYQTLYAHMKNGLNYTKNQKVRKGDTLGYMGDSGNAYGGHLHFEVWKDNVRIDSEKYLNEDLPINKKTPLLYSIGDIVEINGIYVSSTSQEKLRPLITRGTVTKIIENADNPYLLDDGKIGWVNDNVIITNNKYLSNKTYQGTSIVDALNQINVDSSYTNRNKLAGLNGINNYMGTAKQNTNMLNLLKQGLLKY